MFERKKKQTKGLSIIIVGCGKVGITLVQRLVKEGHDISVIDKNPDKISKVMNSYDVFGVVGNGASYRVQMEAGLETADILVAVTGSDELNLLCCVVAKQAGDCDVIARVRTPDYSEDIDYLQRELGLAMIINPEKETAKAISRILYMPTALEVIPFARGLAEVVRIKLLKGNPLADKTISELSLELSGAVLICAVEREGKVYIPNGAFRLEAGDVISFISPVREGRKFLRRMGFHTHRVNNALIVGGSRSAYYLAKLMAKHGMDVKLIESDRAQCEYLSELLPDAIIINGNGNDEELLKEVGIEYAESFVPLTGIDEENILLTLYAQKISDAKVVTKINRINFHEVIDNLDLGSVVYPKYITTEAIVRYVRTKKASMNSNIEAMTHMYDDRVEVIEFLIEHPSKVTNTSLMQLSLRNDLLIACIERDNKIIIPNGSDEIRVGDSVIIVTTHTGFTDILEILK